MNILIVGCGRVGSNLARILQQLGHDISVLESDPAELERLEGFDDFHFKGMACAGIPIDTDTLRHAGIETCDAVAVVTSDDNVNIMVAQIARDIFKIDRVVCRITDPQLKDFFVKEFNIKAICTTNLSVQSMLLGVLQNQESSSLSIGSSTAAFFSTSPTSSQIGRSLSRIRSPRGEIIFGLLHPSGVLQLNSIPGPTVEKGDKLVFARIAD